MFFSYQDNCLIGICWLESHENKSEGLGCSWITATHFCFACFFFRRRYRSYPNPSVLSMQITCRWVDIHSPARLWLDMKLSCCLHQLWLRGLSGLCSDVVWEWRRYSNKAVWANWSESNILYLRPSLLGDSDISITPCSRYALCWTPGVFKAKKLLEQSCGKGINASTQQVALLCQFTDYEWSLYLETLAMLSIQINQSEGSKIYKLWRFKGWNEGTHQQIIFDKFCSSSRGKWKGPLKKNEMDKNTDIYFLRGIKAQNFPLSSQMQSISTLI